jgi:secretion/DNA translocation related TadE-like protein
VLMVCALGMAVASAAAALSVALTATRRADAAADLAALAAAGAPGGTPDCGRAAAVAAANHCRLASCAVQADGSVVVEVTSGGFGLGADWEGPVRGRARAGLEPAAGSRSLGEQRVEQQGRPTLVQRVVAVAALRRLHA